MASQPQQGNRAKIVHRQRIPAPYLVRQTGDSHVEYVIMDSLGIGRLPVNEVVTDDPKVSRRHAELAVRGGGVVARDLNSANGTWVNGQQIDKDHTLHEGDRLTVGDTSYVFYEGLDPNDWDRVRSRMQIINLDGEDLPYLDIGPRNAPALLFVNGAVLSLDFWKYQIPTFAQYFRTVAYDFREEGSRAGSDVGFMEDLRDLVEALRLAPVIIVASSMGALSAQRYAAGYPDRVSALVMYAAFSQFPNAKMIRMGSLASRIIPTSSIAEKSRDAIAGDRDEELRDLYLNTVSAMTGRTLRNRYNILTTANTDDILASIHVPTLVVNGELDEDIPPEIGQHVANRINNAEFRVLQGGGHLGHFEEPGRFNGAVLNWLARQGLGLHHLRAAVGGEG